MIPSKYDKMETFVLLRTLDKLGQNLIVILIGKDAEVYQACFDKTRHDVRDIEPYFFKEDPIDWRIG